MSLASAGVPTVAIGRTVTVAVAVTVAVTITIGARLGAGISGVRTRRGVVRRLRVAVAGVTIDAVTVTVTLAVVTVAPAAHRPEVLLGHASGLAAEGAGDHGLFG